MNGFRSRPIRAAVILATAGAALAGVFLASNLHEDSRIAVVDVRPYNPDFAATRGALNVMMARGDGQGLAVLARDPLMRSSPLPPSETAYLSQRPFVPMVAWAVSLGRPHRVPLGIAVSSVLAGAAAAAGAASLLVARGRSPSYALVLAVLPGSIADVPNGGAENWGLGFALLGLAAWPRRRGVAVAAFTLAALCRETYLVIPAVLFVLDLIRRRVRPSLLVPAAVYMGWAAVVHARVGAWAWESRAGKLDIPLRGLLRAVPHWSGEATVNILTLGLLLAVCAYAFVRRASPTPFVAAYLIFATLLGETVWGRWENFTRVLLPLYAFGVLTIVMTTTASRGAFDPTGS